MSPSGLLAECDTVTSPSPVVVVGTTPDYVAKIGKTYPQTTLFLLDQRFRGHSLLQDMDPSLLLFASLGNFLETLNALQGHLLANGLTPRGIACFDCEYLHLASKLALDMGMPFPSPEAIVHARNKFESRRIWKETGLRTPEATLASGVEETLRFFGRIKRDIVLKPISGSGSELVFRCASEEDIKESVEIMEEQLIKRKANPLFRAIPASPTGTIDPCGAWIVEEFVLGPEFSCDFVLHDSQVTIIRETGKMKALGQTFGSVLAYTFPPIYPEEFSVERLPQALKIAASSLGFTWGYFMMDFIVQNGEAFLIEIAPRPGGDCIPDLVEAATGCDILGIYLDTMCRKLPPPKGMNMPPESFASINLYAPKEGTIISLDPSGVLAYAGVKALVLKKKVGERITLPPNDYDNRLLGYCIVSAEPGWDPASASDDLQRLLNVSIRN